MRRGGLALGACASLVLATAATRGAPPRPRVIVVGWDGADWSRLEPLMRQGRMPELAKLVARGRSDDLATFEPMASPMIWTTVATGRTPVDHGVADFQERDPVSGRLLPVTGRSRRVPAIWNVASACGLRVGVAGWWATWPAEKVNGFLVSDRFAPVLFDVETLARSSALTWPESLSDGVRIVLGREGSPSFEDVARGLEVTRSEFEEAVAARKDLGHPITGYRKILGLTRATARVALELYDRQGPELLMVYLEGTDEIGHVLGRYDAPALPGVSEADARRYGGGVAAFFAEADRLLGEFARRAERDGATLLLLSDHGFRWGGDRPTFTEGALVETAFLWHRSPGILVAAGPDIVPSAKRGKASVFDVAPTLARLLGLPADPAFEGRVLSGLKPRALAAAPKPWASFAPVVRLVPTDLPDDERRVADEFTRKLISLGYLAGAETAAVERASTPHPGLETATGLSNIGTFLRTRGRPAEAVDWYRRSLELNPKSPKAWLNLSLAEFALGRWDEADAALLTSIRSGLFDPEGAVETRSTAYRERAARSSRAGARRLSFLKDAAAALPGSARVKRALGDALFEAKDCPGAEAAFAEAVEKDGRDVAARNGLGLSLLCQGRLPEARRELAASLALKPDQPEVRSAIGMIDGAVSAPRR